ncbi:hypothetical protein OQA88_821 [Cercophora sp. LCS_1]
MSNIISIGFIFLAATRLALATTEFVGNSLIILAASVNPCYLIGDADLYGGGFRSPRLSFNILFFTLIIVLIRNARNGSFALFEWYIVTGLSFLAALALLLPFVSIVMLDDVGLSDEIVDSKLLQRPPSNTTSRRDPSRNGGSDSTGDNTGRADPGHDGMSVRGDDDREHEADLQHHSADNLLWFLRPFLADAIGLGFLLLLWSVSALAMPWLYFAIPHSGHFSDCPVPIFLFGGTFDMYNPRWQTFPRVISIIGVVSSPLFLVVGAAVVLSGLLLFQVFAAKIKDLDEHAEDTAKQPKDIVSIMEEHERAHEQRRGSEATENPLPLHSERQVLQQLAQVRRLELVARANETQVAKLWVDFQQWKGSRKANLWRRRFQRLFITALFGAAGGLNIFFLERTLDLNRI